MRSIEQSFIRELSRGDRQLRQLSRAILGHRAPARVRASDAARVNLMRTDTGGAK